MNSSIVENSWCAEDPQIWIKMHSEAKTRLTSSKAALSVLSANQSASNLYRVFREFHTLKSVAGFMQLDVAVHLAHDAEDVLEQARQGNIELTHDLLQVLADSLQAIEQCFDAAADSPRPLVETNEEETCLSVDPRELLKLIRCIDTFSAFIDPAELADTVDIEGQRVIEFIDGILDEMRALACRLQQVSLDETLQQSARVAKSLSIHLHRPIDIEIVDDDVKINPRTLNALRECLLHLVRNAVDHGIEDPKQRQLACKPACGTLVIKVVRCGEYVEVSVADDGSGIDVTRVANRAAELGLPLPQLNTEDLLRVMCTGGFSTRKDLTELSGRGVGLDVVENLLRSFGGQLSLESEVNKGSRFIIRFRDTIL